MTRSPSLPYVLALRLVLGGGDGVAGEQPGPDPVGHVLSRARSGKGERCNGGEEGELAEDRGEAIRGGGSDDDQFRS